MNMPTLPAAFRESVLAMLGRDEGARFLASYARPRAYGLRLNTLKVGLHGAAAARLAELFALRPVPWCGTGFYYEERTGRENIPIMPPDYTIFRSPRRCRPWSCSIPSRAKRCWIWPRLPAAKRRKSPPKWPDKACSSATKSIRSAPAFWRKMWSGLASGTPW